MRNLVVFFVLAVLLSASVMAAAPSPLAAAIGCISKTGLLDVHLVGAEALTLTAKPIAYIPEGKIGEHECVLEDGAYNIRVTQRAVPNFGRYHDVEIRLGNEVIVPSVGLGLCDRGATNFGDCESQWAVAIQIFVRDGKRRVQFTRATKGE